MLQQNFAPYSHYPQRIVETGLSQKQIAKDESKQNDIFGK